MRHPPLPAPLLWQSLLGFWILGILAVAWPVPSASCAFLLFLADARLWRAKGIFAALAVLLAGVLAGHLTTGKMWRDHTPTPVAWLDTAPKSMRICGQIQEVRGLPDNRIRMLLADVRLHGGAEKPLSGLMEWTWQNPSAYPLPGQSACLSRRPQAMQVFANPGLPDRDVIQSVRNVRWRIWSQGESGQPRIDGQPSLSARWRESLRQDFFTVLSPDAEHFPRQKLPQGKAILVALLFGDRQFLDNQTIAGFSMAALGHSLALSGQHLAVAGLAGILLVVVVARAYPGIYLCRTRTVWVMSASVPPALAYLWLGNAPPSLARATIMLCILALWLLRRRVHTTLDVLCSALFCITLFSPAAVFDTGLQLSAICVAVIGMSMPWLRRLLPRPHPAEHVARWRSLLQDALWSLQRIFALSLIIQTVLLPVGILLFGNTGHWFPLNVLWLPLVNLLVLPGAALGLLAGVCGWDAAARAILEYASLPCQWLADALAWLARQNALESPVVLRPHWTALPAFAALTAATALRGERLRLPPAGRRLLLAGALLLCAGPLLRAGERLSPEVRLDILDVGQSQALLLRLPGHVRLLLDGSGSASPRFDPGKSLVAPVLVHNDAPRLTAVLNSHPDLDHMGGLLYILRHFRTQGLFDNGKNAKGKWGELWDLTRQKHAARPLRQGDTLVLGEPENGLRLEILHPPRHSEDKWRGNNASLVARLLHHERGLALFMGDAERPVLQRLLAEGLDVRAEVLIAPHHGSYTGFLPQFFQAVRPQLVVASCGSRYAYPDKKLREWLAENHISLAYTSRDGAVRIAWQRAGQGFSLPRISTARKQK